MVDDPGHNEERVREPIQVAYEDRGDLLAGRKPNDAPLRSSTDGSSVVQQRRAARPPR
jgi:hypothetical protein